MASPANVKKFESLNSFIHERLTTIAGEIFQVVKDTLSELQEEIYLSKQENIHLKRRLAETSSSVPDTQIKHDDFPLEEQDSKKGLQDSKTSAIQVKVEFGTLPQDPAGQQQLCATSESKPEPSPTAPELPHDISGHVDEDVGVYMGSYVTVKLEQCDSQLTSSVQTDSREVRNGSDLANHDRATKDKPDPPPFSQCVQSSGDPSHAPPRVETSMTGQEMFHCKVCAKSFRHADLFKVHMLLHRKESIYYCDFCGKCYSNNYVLQNHIRTHTGDRPYVCRFCNKTFGRKSNKEEHEKIHTGMRPYSCMRCGKHFIWLNQARLHIQNDHPKETDTIIKKSTKHGMLKMAHTSESENQCELCGKNYSTRQVLRKHLRTHTGERPYKCKFCNKSFTQKCHMMEHERIHTGEKKYSCSECGLSYSWLRQAKVHVQNHHGQGAKIVRK